MTKGQVSRMGKKPLTSGKGYEKIVADVYRQFAGVAEVIENEELVGKSGRTRQIDISLRTEIAGNPLFVVIECKNYTRPVGIAKVDELIGKIDDVGAAMGVLVSDSGFDAGAVARTKSDSRIRLASVLDAENTLLRSKMKMGVSVAFHEIEVKSFSIAAASALSENEFREICVGMQARVEQGFYSWYNENTGEIKAGDNEHRQTITTEDGQKIIATTMFRQNIREFFTDNIWHKGIGIYDFVKREVIKGGDFKRVELDFPYIKANWREKTEDEIKEKIHFDYKILNLYGANTPPENQTIE